MNIVFVTSEAYPVPPVKGGAVEQWIYEVAKRLSGHNIYCLCAYEPLLKDYAHQEGFQLQMYKRGFWGTILLCTYKLPFKQYHSRLYFLPYALWAGWQARRAKADIIHVHSRPHFVWALRLFNSRAKIVLHVHNLSVIEIEGRLWPKSLFDNADQVVTCSEYLREEVLKRYPFLQQKCQVLYNGVDSNRFSTSNTDARTLKAKCAQYKIAEEDQVILFAGRLVEYKGVHILIEAVKKLLNKRQDIKLIILGGLTYSNNQQTPYISKLKDLANGFEDRIIFTGFVSPQDIIEFMALSDIFVVPSLWEEPFGVVVIEAMSMGKPVVAFAKGGIKEIITSGENGILLNDSTPNQLEEALDHLLNHPQKQKELARNALISVKDRFEWSRIIIDVLRTYHHLMNQSHA